jgi:hypothetical protein
MAVDAFIGVGHGITPDGDFDPGATFGELEEHDVAVSVVDAYAEAMKRARVRVADESHSGAGHDDPNLVGSARKANQLRVKYADEVHFNAGGGTGPEVFTHPKSTPANKDACRKISAAIAQVLVLPNRGLKFRDTEGFLVGTNMPSAIIEVAFLDTAADRRAIKRKDTLEKVGEAIARVRLEFLGVEPEEPVEPTTRAPTGEDPHGIPIAAGRPSAAKRRAHAWARSKRSADAFHDIIDAGWDQATEIGIDAAVFVAQAAKETGFGKFGGVIDASFHNSCGLKTTEGGDNDDPAAHKRFRSWETGTRAHCAHLALYAGVITATEARRLGDSRAFGSIRGVAPTVQELGGKWAPALDYGRSIVRDLLRPLRRF